MRQKNKPQLTPSLSNTRNQQKAGTFSDHIAELRRRLMLIALVFVITSALTYTYHEVLVRLIMSPLKGEKLVYLTPGGGFSFIFQVSIYAGLILSAPIIIHHIYAFIRPALPYRAQRSAGKIVLTAVGLVLMGISYGYFVAVPAALHFLSSFAGDSVTPNLTADSYLSFFLSYIAGLALLSLLPLLLIFWHWVKPLTPAGLLKSERWIIVFAFVVAAIITPTPDAANQTMIAGPVILLYQFGVGAVLVSVFRQKRAAHKAAKWAIDIEPDEEKLNQLLADWPETGLELQEAPQKKLTPTLQSSVDTPKPQATTTVIAVPAPHSTQLATSQTLKQAHQSRPVNRPSMDIIARRPPQTDTQRAEQLTRSLQQRQATQQMVQAQRPQLSMEGIFSPISHNATAAS